MTDILENIDAAVAYLESPEYLNQVRRTSAFIGTECTGDHDCGHCADELSRADYSRPFTGAEPTPGGYIARDGEDVATEPVTGDTYVRRTPLSASVSAPVYEFGNTHVFGGRSTSGTVQLTTRSPWWDFRPIVQSATPFRTHGALRAERQTPREYDRANLPNFGHLDRDYHDSVMGADYVVYSYDTPIAWRSGSTGWWWIPDTRYSVTTSRHQSKIRTALHDVTVNE